MGRARSPAGAGRGPEAWLDVPAAGAIDGLKSHEHHDDGDDGLSKVGLQAILRKVSNRLLPLFFAMVIVCYVDRTSLAFAAIQLNASLGFSPYVYGMGSGLFFLGYSIFQIPSNLLLRRFGGPTWLASIIAAWGLTASAFAAMHTAGQFYVLRLLLGLTEAGAFPGMWYILTLFYPEDQITFPFAVVEAGISLSHVVAAPLAAACLSLDGAAGLEGWRWLFVLEGMPTLGLAVAMYSLLPSSPDTAGFLLLRERRALMQSLYRIERRRPLTEVQEGEETAGDREAGDEEVPGPAGGLKCVSNVAGTLGSGGAVKRAKARCHEDSGGEEACGGGGSGGGRGSSSGAGGGLEAAWAVVLPAICNKYVWYLGAVKFVRDIASFGLIFWAPTIVNALLQEMRQSPHSAIPTTTVRLDGEGGGEGGGVTRSLLGAVVPLPRGHHGSGVAAVMLTALPFALAAVAGMTLAHNSQRVGERFLHISLPFIVTGAALTTYTYAAGRSPWLGFLALSFGVVGVYCGSGILLSLVSELAAGPGLVVALPLYNSLGTLGGFLGPTIVGCLVQRAYRSASMGDGEGGIIQGGGFGASAMVLGSALVLAGGMVLSLGFAMGRLPLFAGPGQGGGAVGV